MSILAEYQGARHDEEIARLRRVVALRALIATGSTQRSIAGGLGVSQPAISQQLKQSDSINDAHPSDLVEAAGPVLRTLAAERGYLRFAVFGSVARGEASADSDIDLVVEAPSGTSTFDFLRFKQMIETVLGREVDLVEYSGLTPVIDDDVRRDARLL